jgi:hypothetical protein
MTLFPPMTARIDRQSILPTPFRPRQALENLLRPLSDLLDTETPALSDDSSEEDLLVPEFEAHAAELFDLFAQEDLVTLTRTLTDHASTYRLVAQWHREHGLPDILGFPPPDQMHPSFVPALLSFIERLFDTERTAIAITDFLSGLCAASHSWNLFLLRLDPLRLTISRTCCLSSAPDLIANAIRLLCHFWDCELRAPSADIGHVLHFILPFAVMSKRVALAVISALHVVISTPHFCDAHGSVVDTCDIMWQIMVTYPSSTVKREIVGLYEHMIRQQVDRSVLLAHSGFEAFVLELNAIEEGAEYRFPPLVLTFITDGLRKSSPVRQQEILAKLKPELLLNALTSSDAQIREEFIVAVTLFIHWRQLPWEVLYQPHVFAQIATFFVASVCPRKVLCLKFCHALVLINPLAGLALFPVTDETHRQVYEDLHGEEQVPDTLVLDDDVSGETRPLPWNVMGESSLLQWICDLIDHGEETAAYCLDTLLLIIHSDTQVLAGNSADGERIHDFIAQLATCQNFKSNLLRIAHTGDTTPYALADGLRPVLLPECAELITQILGA